LESGYVGKIEREVEDAKEEHLEPGNRRKHQHLRYDALMYFFYIH
jgi:hypothetical protein